MRHLIIIMFKLIQEVQLLSCYFGPSGSDRPSMQCATGNACGIEVIHYRNSQTHENQTMYQRFCATSETCVGYKIYGICVPHAEMTSNLLRVVENGRLADPDVSRTVEELLNVEYCCCTTEYCNWSTQTAAGKEKVPDEQLKTALARQSTAILVTDNSAISNRRTESGLVLTAGSMIFVLLCSKFI